MVDKHASLTTMSVRARSSPWITSELKKRPISVILVVAKVLERIVYDQLYACLEKHSIICKYQSSFIS